MNTLKKLLVATILCMALVFSVAACGEEFTDEYATMLTPVVEQQSDEAYSWVALEDVTGYVIEINGEKKGIGNPVSENMMYGKYCEYVLDTESLGLGVHTIRFASYKFDEKKGTVLSDWTKEFYVVNELPEAIESISIFGKDVYVTGVEGNTIELVFNDSITATYTTPDKLPIYSDTISLDEFVFSAELADETNYDVKAYVTNAFGKSEDYKATQYYHVVENAIAPALGVLEDGAPVFYFASEIENALVTIKFNDTEYTVALAGDCSEIDLADVIELLSVEDSKVIYETLVKQDCVVSLKLVNAQGITEGTEYSNEVTMKALGEEFVEMLAEQGSVTANGGVLQVVSNSFGKVYEGTVTVKVTVTGADGVAKEIAPLDDAVAYADYYDVLEAVAFGMNTVKVEQIVNFADIEKTAELYNVTASINSQVKSVSLAGNNVVWNSNGLNDGYKVQIVDVNGNVSATFETKNNYWNTEEYEINGGSFNVKVVPVLNGVDGTQSPVLKIYKASAVSVYKIEETLNTFVIEGEDGKTINAKVIVDGPTGKEILQSSTLTSDEQKMTISKSGLYGYGAFEIVLQSPGNGINTVDSKETVAKFLVSDCLTFDVKDGELVKVSGVAEDQLLVNFKKPADKFFEEGWFSIKDYFEYEEEAEFDNDDRIIFGDKIDSISDSSVNVIVKPLVFNMDSTQYIATTPYGISYSASTDSFVWYGNEYNEYAYEIIGADDKVVSSGTKIGPKLDVKSLAKGEYTIRIKLLGNGQVLNSFWVEFDYEVLTAGSYSTETDVDAGYTRLNVTVTSDNVVPVLYRSKSSSYTYSRVSGEEKNEYYFLLNTDTTSDPYLTYEYAYAYGCDYCSDISEISKEIDLVYYNIYQYNPNYYGSSYKTFYNIKNYSDGQKFLKPVLSTTSYGDYIVGSAPVKVSSTNNRYEYVIDTGYTPDASILKATSNFANDYYLVTIDYSNASGYEGMETSKFYTTIDAEKVKVEYVYVKSGEGLINYLNTYVPLGTGYAYYTDVAATETVSTNVTAPVTVYVGAAQA